MNVNIVHSPKTHSILQKPYFVSLSIIPFALLFLFLFLTFSCRSIHIYCLDSALN